MCDLVSKNPHNFLACGAASRSLRRWRSDISFSAKCLYAVNPLTVTRRCFHCGASGCYTFSDNDTALHRTRRISGRAPTRMHVSTLFTTAPRGVCSR